MGTVYIAAGGAHETGMYFIGKEHVLCWRHKRKLQLQPVTNVDRKHGFGTGKCPFCEGGELYGKYHKHRSGVSVERAIHDLEHPPVKVDPPDRNDSCEARIDYHLENELATIKDLWEYGLENDFDEYHPEHQINLYDYALDFGYVEPYTFNDQPEPYWRWQLSWGGPSDEFRFFVNDGYIYRIEYWFMDWFDGAHRTLSGEDKELMSNIFSFFHE